MELHIEFDGTYMNVIKFGKGRRNLAVIAGVSLCGLEGLGNQIEEAYKVFSEDFTVYVFDRRKILEPGYTMDQMAEDIHKCLIQLGVESACVYGVSQGGMLGQLIALNHPKFVEKLVLCSTVSKVEKSNKAFKEWKEASAAGDVVRLNSLFLKYVYSDAFRESIKESIPALLKQGTSEDCRRFSVLVESMLGFDVTERLTELKCPVLVICDRSDQVFDCAEELKVAEITGAKKFIYDGYGHAVYDEAPDLKEKIAEFCRQ
ncbi:MAG: alpha/beta hydrolase [Treponema sp.]|nr:alpha/beta hydrolase [Treponema sp.]